MPPPTLLETISIPGPGLSHILLNSNYPRHSFVLSSLLSMRVSLPALEVIWAIGATGFTECLIVWDSQKCPPTLTMWNVACFPSPSKFQLANLVYFYVISILFTSLFYVHSLAS